MIDNPYCVGQEIVLVVDTPDGNRNLHKGDTGTIFRIFGADYSYAVECDFHRNIKGNGGGEYEDFSGRYADNGNAWCLEEGWFEVVGFPTDEDNDTIEISDDDMLVFLS